MSVRQLIFNTIYFVKNIQTQMDITLFRRLFSGENASTLNGLWQQCDYNIVEFYKALKADQKQKFEAHLARFTNRNKSKEDEKHFQETKEQTPLQHVETAYRILAIVYRKFLEQFNTVPSDLQSLWEKIKKDNMVYFVGILGESLVELFLNWCESSFDIQEFLNLSLSRPYPFANMAKVYQSKESATSEENGGGGVLLLPTRLLPQSVRNKGGKPRMAMFPGSTPQPISKVNHSIKNVNNSAPSAPNSTTGAVRSFAQLQKAFGEI
jgi:hypothetical protein